MRNDSNSIPGAVAPLPLARARPNHGHYALARQIARGLSIALALSLAADAADRVPAAPKRTAPATTEIPAPPPLPSGALDSTTDELEPEVTITTKGAEIHEEYRLNGALYLVKVKPAKGPPYYLVYDERGNSRRSDLEPDIVVPSWVIKRF